MKRLFWGVLVATELIGCGGGPSGRSIEPSGRDSTWQKPPSRASGAAAASAPATAEDLARGRASDSGPLTRCSPTGGEGQAVVRCDPDRIVPAGPLLFNPDRPVPPSQQRGLLDAVAQLMHRRQDILLLRIEVTCHLPAPNAAARRRAMRQAQRRADALFGDLWRRGRVSAERMEAVGLSAPVQTDARQDYSTELRVMQWALPSSRTRERPQAASR